MSETLLPDSSHYQVNRTLMGALLILMCGLIPLSENAVAQMESSNFRLANGGWTGGGGRSSGTGVVVVGSVPI